MKELNLCDNCVYKGNCPAVKVYYGESDNVVDCDSYVGKLIGE